MKSTTEKTKLARVKKQGLKLIADIRRMENQPVPPSPLEAFRQAIAPKNHDCKKSSEKFDIRNTGAKPTSLSDSLPTMQTIADAYGLSRQMGYNIMKKLELDRAQMMDPDVVFQAMLKHSAASLRTRLVDPANREAIRQKLSPQTKIIS